MNRGGEAAVLCRRDRAFWIRCPVFLGRGYVLPISSPVYDAIATSIAVLLALSPRRHRVVLACLLRR